jgi:hypothetical protein
MLEKTKNLLFEIFSEENQHISPDEYTYFYVFRIFIQSKSFKVVNGLFDNLLKNLNFPSYKILIFLNLLLDDINIKDEREGYLLIKHYLYKFDKS